MATNTTFLSLSKPDYSDPADVTVINGNFDKIDAAIGQRSRVENLLVNPDFRQSQVVNQRGWTSGTTLATGGIFIDCWHGATNKAVTPTISESGVLADGEIYQVLSKEGLVGQTVTAAIWLSDGSVIAKSGVIPEDGTWANFINTASGGTMLMVTNTSEKFLRFRITCGSLEVKCAALYPGSYRADNVAAFVPNGYTSELLSCQKYYHLYGTSAARPSHGKDCVPHMIADAPTQGTVSIGGKTYYYNSADL